MKDRDDTSGRPARPNPSPISGANQTQRAPPAMCRRGSRSSAPCDQDADGQENEEAPEPAGALAEQVQQRQPAQQVESHRHSPSGAGCSGASSLPTTRVGRLKASGCCVLPLGDDLGHRAVVTEGPAVASRHVPGGGGVLDQTPGAVDREADHRLARLGTGAAALACGLGVRAGQIAIRRPAGVCVGSGAMRSRHSAMVSAHSSGRLFARRRTTRLP